MGPKKKNGIPDRYVIMSPIAPSSDELLNIPGRINQCISTDGLIIRQWANGSLARASSHLKYP